MAISLYQVDAFTDEPFAGNPAAVCILTESRDEAWMQAVAREMNLSETAFLRGREDGFDLRWFTPVVEVELCGHATLASAHVLWEAGLLESHQQARFRTQSGLLTAERYAEWIELDLPARVQEPVSVPPGLLEALGVAAEYVGRGQFDYLVEVASEDAVRKLEPDLAQLKKLGTRGVIVTSRAATAPYDFVSRFFAPGAGIDEDPVTGAAHCYLGPFWAERLGKDEMVAFQASVRGGVVRVRAMGERVQLGGQAVTVMRGELIV